MKTTSESRSSLWNLFNSYLDFKNSDVKYCDVEILIE